MRHPASKSWWFFASQWAGPQKYSDFCFALWRIWFHNPARDVHETHLEMSQESISLCPDFPWAEHTKPSCSTVQNKSIPALGTRILEGWKLLTWQQGIREENLNLTPLHRLFTCRAVSSSEGQRRTNLGQNKEYFSPFSCQAMVSMRRNLEAAAARLVANWSKLCWSRASILGVSHFCYKALLLDIVTHYHDISTVSSDYLKYRSNPKHF